MRWKRYCVGFTSQEYLLPAIQREFVWDGDQVRRLVDSLMRGYPIGSFLIWDVDTATADTYTFYNFLTDYHERDDPIRYQGSCSGRARGKGHPGWAAASYSSQHRDLRQYGG